MGKVLKCIECEWIGSENQTVDHFCPDCGSVTDYYDGDAYTWMVDGVKVYDPRDNTMSLSSNPALIYADIIEREIVVVAKRETFWLEICNMANHCDMKVEI